MKKQKTKWDDIRRQLSHAYDLGRLVPHEFQTHVSNINTMTPKELEMHSGGSSIRKEQKKAEKRKQKAIEDLVKRHRKYKTFEEFVITVNDYYNEI